MKGINIGVKKHHEKYFQDLKEDERKKQNLYLLNSYMKNIFEFLIYILGFILVFIIIADWIIGGHDIREKNCNNLGKSYIS